MATFSHVTGSTESRRSFYTQTFLVFFLTFLICVPLLSNPAFIFDDYRYLDDIHSAGTHPGAWLKLLVVENRWDNNWWIAPGTYVRFFRPLVAPSFALDAWLWGMDARGFALTNILLHCLATLLVWLCLTRLLKPRWTAFIAALSFGTLGCHFENIWYFSGRTDTLAAIAFLGCIYFYLRERNSKNYYGTVACFFVALLAKEYNIMLPFLIFGLEKLAPCSVSSTSSNQGRGNSRLYLAFGLVFLLYLLLRYLIVGDSGTQPFPYFFMPFRTGFMSRTSAVLAQYLTSLVNGIYARPFLSSWQSFLPYTGILDLLLAFITVTLLLLLSFRDGLSKWFAVILFLPLCASLPLYASARYLYIPSFGYVGLLAIGYKYLWERKHYLSLLLAGFFTLVLPANNLNSILDDIPLPSPTPNEFVAMLEASGVLKSNRPIYFVNFPFDWLANQFAMRAGRVLLDRDIGPHYTLSLYREAWESQPSVLRKLDANTIEISRGGAALYNPDPEFDFDQRHLEVGEQLEFPDHSILVKGSEHGKATVIQVKFKQVLEEVALICFVPDPKGRMTTLPCQL